MKIVQKMKKLKKVDLQNTENELIESIKRGNTDAFRRFVELHEKSIANIVIGMLGDTQEAENIAQDVFIKFFYNVAKFRKESSARTYLTRIAINLSLNEIKKNKIRKGRIENVENIASYEGKAIHDPGNFELRDVLNEELEKLEKGQRAVFILRMIEGYSTKETAKILKIPQGTVLSRLYRATEIMKNRLKEYKYH